MEAHSDGTCARVDEALGVCWERGKGEDQSFGPCVQKLIRRHHTMEVDCICFPAPSIVRTVHGRQSDGVEVRWAPVCVRSGDLWIAAVKGFGEWLQIILENVKNAYRQKLTRSLARNVTTPPDD